MQNRLFRRLGAWAMLDDEALRAELAAQDMAALKQRAEAEQVVEMFRPFEVVEDRETIIQTKPYRQKIKPRLKFVDRL